VPDIHVAPVIHVASAVHAASEADFRLPPRAWAAQDPADSLWRAARRALDAGNAMEAAAMYRQIRAERRFAQSEYRPHAYYWEAFARNRMGGAAELNRALEALRELRGEYPRFENMREVDRLESRINGQLAARGDTSAASRRAEQVAQALSQCPDQELRIAVLEALMSSPAEQAMPTLRQVMARRDECSAPLREKALFIISQQRTAEAEDLLVEAAKSDPDPKVREQGVFWLSQVNTERAVAAIDEILRTTDDPKLMEHAVFALSQHRSPRAAEILRDIATREGAPREARKNAIFWMGQSGGPNAGGFLRTLYGSLDDPDLKEAALFALSQSGGANADFLFAIALDPDEPVEVRKNALFWAGQQRSLPLDRLGELYESMPDRGMREQIIFTISQRREPEAVDRLIDIVRNETDMELRKNAIFWLGQSRDPRAIRFLTELIGG
jgi:HEAT repeat protein